MRFFNFILLLALVITNINCCTHNVYHPNIQPQDINQKNLIEYLEDSTVVVLKEHGDKYRLICSAVWISDDLFLSARHCFKNDEENVSQDISAIPGTIVPYKVHAEANEEFTVKHKPHFAIVIAVDPQQDLALVSTIDHPKHTFVLISSDKLYDGQAAHIVGHTAGVLYTYFPGVIANSDRRDSPFGVPLRTFQISAPIFGGNSGCGIFDTSGRLLGIFSYMITKVPSMGFAIHRDEIVSFIRKENALAF
jgi:hypothetical protein